MRYEEFKEQFLDELTKVLENTGERIEAHSCEYDTSNKKVDGLVLRMDNSNLAPTIHVNTMYETWKTSNLDIRGLAENVCNVLKEEFEKIKEFDFSIEKFTPEFVKEHSYLSVVNTEMNTTLLENIPHEEIKGTDLSAYVKVNVANNATITITNEHAYGLQMTRSELLDVAKENTLEQSFSVRSMESVLKDIMPAEIVDDMQLFPEGTHPNMVMITNETGYEGANAILSEKTLDKACEELGSTNITILPSSRHELLAINIEELNLSVEELKDMVREINGTEVELEDQLSNNVYKYDGITHQLEIADEQILSIEQEDFEIIDCGMSLEG